jgi:hypothetical protein
MVPIMSFQFSALHLYIITGKEREGNCYPYFNKRRGKSHPLAGDWDESAVPFLEG